MDRASLSEKDRGKVWHVPDMNRVANQFVEE